MYANLDPNLKTVMDVLKRWSSREYPMIAYSVAMSLPKTGVSSAEAELNALLAAGEIGGRMTIDPYRDHPVMQYWYLNPLERLAEI